MVNAGEKRIRNPRAYKRAQKRREAEHTRLVKKAADRICAIIAAKHDYRFTAHKRADALCMLAMDGAAGGHRYDTTVISEALELVISDGRVVVTTDRATKELVYTTERPEPEPVLASSHDRIHELFEDDHLPLPPRVRSRLRNEWVYNT